MIRTNQQYGNAMKAAHEKQYGAVPVAPSTGGARKKYLTKKLVDMNMRDRNNPTPKSVAIKKKTK